MPRAFGTYDVYAETVDLLIRTEAVPEATFLWWTRPQPALGTIEIRVMDAQTRCRDTAALVAPVQCLVKLEAEQGYASDLAIACRGDLREPLPRRSRRRRRGADRSRPRDADPGPRSRRGPARDLPPHAQELGREEELAAVTDLIEDPPAKRQITTARHAPSLGRLVERLSDRFAERPGV